VETQAQGRVNVFIVEDDQLTRDSLRARVEAHPRLRVGAAVGTAADGLAALAVARPDVLLVDLGLPDGSGIDVIRGALRRYPGLAIMVITVFGNEQRVVGAIQAGASGYLLKDDATHEIGMAIELLLGGGSPISPAIARHLIRHFQAPAEKAGSPPESAPEARETLSARELEVLHLASKGFSYAEIAQLLGLSPNTIASYTKHIYVKLAVGSRSEAIYEASRLGLLPTHR
jgi:DNA-binding NarL/FixJ family response regulator